MENSERRDVGGFMANRLKFVFNVPHGHRGIAVLEPCVDVPGPPLDLEIDGAVGESIPDGQQPVRIRARGIEFGATLNGG